MRRCFPLVRQREGDGDGALMLAGLAGLAVSATDELSELGRWIARCGSDNLALRVAGLAGERRGDGPRVTGTD